MTARLYPPDSFPASSVSTSSVTSSGPSGELPRIIVLVGLMGAGKTTLGRILARRYNMEFVDSDNEIEQAAGCSISEIFERHGEAYFREGEHRVIKRLLQNGPCVLATGGGAWMNALTRRAVQQTPYACSVWLRAPFEILLQRLMHSPNKRPLLQENDPAEMLKCLATQREPYYAQSDIIVDCGARSVERSVRNIHKALGQYARNSAPKTLMTRNPDEMSRA